MKLHHQILIYGGLLITLNALFPPMIYDNWMLSDGSHKTLRHFFTTTECEVEIKPGPNVTASKYGKFPYKVTLNVSRLATQEFLIIGLMCIALGFTIPKDETTPPAK